MPMITQEWAENFAQEWVHAWNTADLDAVMAHYADDFEMTSPKIQDFANISTGTLKGKPAVRAHWADAIARVPNRNFEIISVLVSVESVVIYYNAVGGKKAAEIFIFNDDLQVVRSIAHYSPSV